MKSGGIHHYIKEIEDMTTPVSRLVRARIPSLILGLLGGLVAVYIVNAFENILSSYFVLASFIPLMIYLSDAIGTQSQTLIVRMIALEPEFSVKRYLAREVKVGGILGIIFASLLFAAASVGWGLSQAGAIIGLSILISIVFQAVISTYLSISLAKFNVDPAVTSGPLTTIISDIATLTMVLWARGLFFLGLSRYSLHLLSVTMLRGINFGSGASIAGLFVRDICNGLDVIVGLQILLNPIS